MAGEEKSSVERLKGRLYARKSALSRPGAERAPLSNDIHSVPVSWQVDAPRAAAPTPALRAFDEKPRIPFATKFLIGSIVFFLGAAGVATFVFFGGGNIVSSRNIDLQVIAPSLIDGGKEAMLEILITNRNRTDLELSDLIITYPEGTRDPEDLTRSLTHERQSIGTIESGAQSKQTARAVFYGGEGSQQKVLVTLEYTIKGSNAVFVKEGEVDFIIGSSPVALSVEAPASVVAGEPFPLEVVVQSNAATPVESVVVEGQYPFGFSVLEASPSPDAGGRLWRLGSMDPGESKTIRLTGVVEASEGDERVFRFLVGSDADVTATRVEVPFLSQPVSVSVQQPFIAGKLRVDGQTAKNIAVPAGKTLQGYVEWQNNLSEALSDVEVQLVFEGPMLDASSVAAQNGFYSSNTRTIVWTKEQDPSLARVSPGETSSLPFSFATVLPGSGGVVYTNPVVNLNLTIRADRQSESGAQTVSSTITTQVTLASSLALSAQALHFEGPFTNTGPMPPEVGEETSYSIVWTVRNSSNTIAGASVAAVLPPYVRFAASAPGAGVTYEESSRTVRWDIGDLGAGVGYSTPERQAAFQVVLTPSSSQAGQAPALTGAALFTGQDRFAQVAVQASAEAPTTVLRNDNDFENGMGSVEN